MLAPADTDRLLDLLREAGDEAVTLDELAVVGVQDPASALLSLELAGFGVERIYERAGTGTRTCVRLRTQVDPSPVQFMEPQPARDHRKAATFGVLALLLLLIARR
jgi:hypothetical protein